MTKTYEINYNLGERDSRETRAKILELREQGLYNIMYYEELKAHEAKTWLEQQGFTIDDLLACITKDKKQVKRAKKGKGLLNWLQARRLRNKCKLDPRYKEIAQYFGHSNLSEEELSKYKRPVVPDGGIERSIRYALRDYVNSDYVIIYDQNSFDRKTYVGNRLAGCTLYNLKESEKPVAVIKINRGN